MKNENISLEEKIDFIYNKLKKDESEQKRKFIIKTTIRVFLVVFLLYMYFFGINQIISGVKNSMIQYFNDRKEATVEFFKEKKDSAADFINNGKEKSIELYESGKEKTKEIYNSVKKKAIDMYEGKKTEENTNF
ncbi:hypothetical protein BKN14_01420 [Candidatus Gracilibacteria bacterium HOT-871]|nr:hypothetical protein BKN14_01420 [Candidatus Gracilibacteria bacterium HOT-871]MBF0914053.1 hypothetical protein [Candidatus Gracilibacteria bacterium]RKW23661.1 MAG: hypothetical protein D8B46_03000 [Candidatus Gracilibacteria bacterium]